MAWEKEEGAVVDPEALEHQPYGGVTGQEAHKAWVESERIRRGLPVDKIVGNPHLQEPEIEK